MAARVRRQFMSPKCRSPVPDRGGIGHDLLVQLSLDPEISEIGHLDQVAMDDLLVDVDAITIRRDDGVCFAIDCEGLRRGGDSVDDALVWVAAGMMGFERLPVTRADVMAEPGFANARAVWSYRDCTIDPRMKFEIVTLLHEDGPLRFHEVCQRVPGPRDPVATIFAMCCANLIEIDLGEMLDQHTFVRARGS